MLEQDLVNEDNFVYLLPYKEYFKTHDLTLEELNRIIPTSYRALFNIK
ncbi:MAG: hypothetical protein LBC61_03810 [Candidatus Peribacteria bacterium]|nr:hypothetical protein [Candidatus Peribacteria bacterium]